MYSNIQLLTIQAPADTDIDRCDSGSQYWYHIMSNDSVVHILSEQMTLRYIKLQINMAAQKDNLFDANMFVHV